MATGKASDFVIYQEEFQTAMVDELAQNLAGFGPASRNAIRIVPQVLAGDYEKKTFFDDTITISRRDTTSTSAQTASAMTMDENISVKINRKANLMAMTVDAFRKKGLAEEAAQRQFSAALGQMLAKKKVQDYLNTALIAVEAAIQGNTAMNYDNTGNTADHLTHVALAEGRALFGDAFGNIVAWVGHSRAYHDNQIDTLASANMIVNVGGTMVNAGNVPTLGLPFVVTDASALINGSGSTATYNVLGLVPDAVVLTESEPGDVMIWKYGGNENMEFRLQAEWAYNIQVKGFKWDTTNGGANPTDGTLGTTTNWDQVVADDKNTAGVRILVDVNV